MCDALVESLALQAAPCSENAVQCLANALHGTDEHAAASSEASRVPHSCQRLPCLPLACREWHGISEIYLNLTRSVGCLHHFAWKANSSEVGQLRQRATPGLLHAPPGCIDCIAGGSLECVTARSRGWQALGATQQLQSLAPQLAPLQRIAQPADCGAPRCPCATPCTHVVLQWVMYLEKEDAKYSHWTAEECSSRCAGGRVCCHAQARCHAQA